MTAPMASAPKQLETKWTDGPWEQVRQHGAGPIIAHRYETGQQMQPTGLRLVCHVLQRGDSLKQDEANAALIAAAPEMVEVLEWLCEQMLAEQEAGVSGFEDWLTPARAAIAKARGDV